MAVTDIIVLVYLGLMGVIGGAKGFWRTLAGPMALIVCLGIAWIVWKTTHHAFISGAIALVGPYLLSWLINQGLRRWLKPDTDPVLSFISMLSGSLMNMTLAVLFLLPVAVLLTVFPFNRFELENAGRDAARSVTLKLVKPILVDKGILPADPSPALCLGDICRMTPATNQTLADDPEVKAIISDPRIQKLMNDPKTMEDFQGRNIAALMQNPVIAELRSDPDFMLKAMKAYPRIQKQLNEKRPTEKTDAQ
jgi:hypothetical protein